MGGTEVLCLDSCFVFLIYSLISFRAGFFFSLKEFFLLVCFIYNKKKKIYFFKFDLYILRNIIVIGWMGVGTVKFL